MLSLFVTDSLQENLWRKIDALDNTMLRAYRETAAV